MPTRRCRMIKIHQLPFCRGSTGRLCDRFQWRLQHNCLGTLCLFAWTVLDAVAAVDVTFAASATSRPRPGPLSVFASHTAFHCRVRGLAPAAFGSRPAPHARNTRLLTIPGPRSAVRGSTAAQSGGEETRAAGNPEGSEVTEHRVPLVDDSQSPSTEPQDPHPLSMQVLTQLPKASLSSQSNTRRNKNKPPVLLFLHGSFHGAWCWSEHWFGHFCDLGYPVAALSWRGAGGTPAGPGVRRVPIGQHVRDLRTVLASLPSLVFGQDRANEERDRGVVLIAHSFGGITVMKLLEAHPEMLLEQGGGGAVTDPFPPIRGIAMLCSVPPSGNAAMTARYLRRSLKLSWRITAGFALKRCCTDPDLCRFLFFGGKDEDPEAGTVTDEELARYMSYFERDSEATIDLLDLSRRLPSKAADRRSGRAPYHESLPPCLVLGGADDVIVDREGFDETARYFDIGPTGDAPSGPDRIVVKPSVTSDALDRPRHLKEAARYTDIYLTMVDSPHDVMLGRTWRKGAHVVEDWLSRLVL